MKVARDLLFIVAGGNSNPLALNDVSRANAYKTTTYIVTKSVLKCNWLLLLKPLVTLSNSHFDIYVDHLIVLIVSPVTSDLHCGPVSPHTPFMENTNSTPTPTLQNGKSILQGFQKKYNNPDLILLHEKFLQFVWLRAVAFQLYLKYLHVIITNLLQVSN